jgi:hypothetical protein
MELSRQYTTDEQEELKMTDRIAVSTYVQGNGQKLKHTLTKKQQIKSGWHYEKDLKT